jgi:DMSO/TMAO reductase YedYZ molybdopterin-dependent catalytic subunit
VRTSRGWWWLSGIVAGAFGVAASYLVASLLRIRESPVVAVAEGVIALTPGPVARWAIDTFGAADKVVLLLGMFAILAVVFGWLGHLARRRWWASVTGFGVLAAVGAVAIVAKPGANVVEFVPLVIGLIAWLLGLAVLAEWLRRWELIEASEDDSDPTHSRRGFLLTVGAVGVGAVLSGVLGHVAERGRRAVEESRRLLRLDGVTKPPVPEGVPVGIEGVTPWQTAVPDFYLIDTAIIKPTIDPRDWQLRVHGMVDRELVLDYDDLLRREMTEDWITLNCVSNEVGGDLIGNAWWSGVRLAGILADAGIQEGADAILQSSEDGWTCGTPLATVTDGRNAMLAVAMNGAALEIEHGFPVRTIVPGLYGYVSACKWVVDIEVTRFDDITAYWTDKGWAELGPVKLSSRIDVPRAGDTVPPGIVVCAGVAWAQRTGIERVEVSLDGGAWVAATLGQVPNVDTWVQWTATVTGAEEGDHELRVRAVDREGTVQTGVVSDVKPDGATGWHTIEFTVSG